MISVIIPCFNEEAYIVGCVESLIDETLGEEYEILISDGGSTDTTLSQIGMLQKRYSEIRLLHNPRKIQVHALNQMLDECRGDVVIRCDAHSNYPGGYIKKLSSTLREDHMLGNVGVPVKCVPGDDSEQAKAIANVLSHPLGVGPSHRTSIMENEIRDVDTLLFGAWRKAVLDEVGWFDTEFVRGQDYEHNVRVKKSGYRVAQIAYPDLSYFGRRTFGQLFRMIMQYASCKPFIMKKHGRFPNVRSIVPLLSLICFCVIAGVSIHLATLLALLYGVALFSVFYVQAKDFVQAMLRTVGAVTAHLAHALGTAVGLVFACFGGSPPWEWGGTR